MVYIVRLDARVRLPALVLFLQCLTIRYHGEHMPNALDRSLSLAWYQALLNALSLDLRRQYRVLLSQVPAVAA